MKSCPTPLQAAGTELSLRRMGDGPFVTVHLQAGDTLRGESGVAWGTVDGRPEDVIVFAERPYHARRSEQMLLTGLGGPAVVTIVPAPSSARPAPPLRRLARLAGRAVALWPRPRTT